MISHRLSWREEVGVESLRAGAFLHRASEILGLFLGVWEQTPTCLLLAESVGMFETVTCALGKQLWLFGYLLCLRHPPGWEQGCSCFPVPAWVGPGGLKDAQGAVV